MNLHHISKIYEIQLASYPASLHESQDMFANIINASNYLCYIALQKEEIIGYILGYPTQDTRNNFDQGFVKIKTRCNCVYLHDLCIKIEKRGLNISRLLLEAFFADASKMGYKKIIAVAIADSIKFWTKIGFVQDEDCLYNGNRASRIYKYI
jgi:GNAT superfamily N-acetyltransferase